MLTEFNYITEDWTQWDKNYVQGLTSNLYTIPQITANGLDVTGITAALGEFQFRVMVRGYTEAIPTGGHRITIQEAGIFVWDSFNFDGEYNLRFWRCSPAAFSLVEKEGFINLYNSDFQGFRREFGVGNDFLVLSHVRRVDLGEGFSYETEL